MTRRQNIEIIEQMEQAMADIQPELDKRFKVPLWVPIIYGLCSFEHDSPECVIPYCPNCGACMDGAEGVE